MTDVYADVEGALRTWLRTRPAITDLVAQRVFFGIPKQATETSFPMIVLSRVGGGDEAGDAAIDTATIQFDCYGSIDASSGYGKKYTATELKNALRSELNTIAGDVALTATVNCLGAAVESDVWLPDTDDDRPRYVITATVSTISL